MNERILVIKLGALGDLVQAKAGGTHQHGGHQGPVVVDPADHLVDFLPARDVRWSGVGGVRRQEILGPSRRRAQIRVALPVRPGPEVADHGVHRLVDRAGSVPSGPQLDDGLHHVLLVEQAKRKAALASLGSLPEGLPEPLEPELEGRTSVLLVGTEPADGLLEVRLRRPMMSVISSAVSSPVASSASRAALSKGCSI